MGDHALMTARQIKELLYQAAANDDAALALKAAKVFRDRQLWTSSNHYKPTPPNGTEKLIIATKPGTCVLCDEEFEPGIEIRWRSRVDCHPECWLEKFS